MTFTPLKHIVFVPGPPWGHLRPGLKTSLRMVEKFPNLFISLFVYNSEVPKAIKYLGAQPSTYSKRIRIVTATSGEGDPAVTSGNEIEVISCLEKAFGLWITNELQQATIIQLEGQPINEPSLIIEDIFAGGVALACKNVHKLPIVAWWLMTAASMMFIPGNKDSQDTGIFDKLVQGNARSEDKLAKRGGKSPKGVSAQLICIPGIPPHYEWEFATQELPFMQSLVPHMLSRWKNMVQGVDSVICCSTFEFEPITSAALSNVFSTTPFLIGPSVDLTPPQQLDPDSPVTQFLDRAYTEKGAHSVVYVAFGTLFFPPPTSISLLKTALDEIAKAGFRFIFALSSDRAQVEKSWMDAYVQAGNAIFPEWTNQTAVLEHPAIHYFLSHGGWNSSTEAIVRGVPMIFWPIAANQPLNALQIASGHDCGFELLQVRTGPAKSTAYRDGAVIKIQGTDDAVREEMRHILELSKGSRGEHQRANVRLLGKIITESLAPGGSADVGLERFGKTLGLA
ncbi:hypothetical protein OPQ81_001072 [Rhizoctonia solani]|nr:hypothetical protein OPQ81_001072 [Rhizoctonia solani]